MIENFIHIGYQSLNLKLIFSYFAPCVPLEAIVVQYHPSISMVFPSISHGPQSHLRVQTSLSHEQINTWSTE
jgi:hypothetical protein